FRFQFNPVTTRALEQGEGWWRSDVWQGYSAVVQPFQAPELAPGEIFVAAFDILVQEEDLPQLVGQLFQVYGGEGLGDGTPDPKRGAYFFSEDPTIPPPY